MQLTAQLQQWTPPETLLLHKFSFNKMQLWLSRSPALILRTELKSAPPLELLNLQL